MIYYLGISFVPALITTDIDTSTGFYGDKNVEAVKDYQTSKGLPITGMVHDFTRQAIKAESYQ